MCIWIMPLLTIVFTLLVHCFLKKCMRKTTPEIYQFYDNSSSKILVFCFAVDFELIESIVAYLYDARTGNTPYETLLNNTSENSIVKVTKNIANFVLKISICFFILCWVLFKLGCLIAHLSIALFAVLSVIFNPEKLLFIKQFDLTLTAIIAYTLGTSAIYIARDVFGAFPILDVVKSLPRQFEILFFFLITFVPYYVIISAALYFLVFFFFS